VSSEILLEIVRSASGREMKAEIVCLTTKSLELRGLSWMVYELLMQVATCMCRSGESIQVRLIIDIIV